MQAERDAETICRDLWRHSGPRLRRLAHHLLGQDADDGLQEAFGQIQRGLASFRGEAALSTWAYRVATLALLGYRRSRARRRRRERPSALTVESLDPATLACIEEEPLRKVQHAETRARVRQAVAALPEPYRTVIVLRSFEGLRYAEISELMGVPLGTVKSRIAAASVRLANALREELRGEMEVES